ncbi:MAG: tetratricopeptide repeat protein, partial [Candidatus Riflebacteria bacterium]|nr:tetratricopeptide repeat protein [Candidatus Riflebacteria bacterium]
GDKASMQKAVWHYRQAIETDPGMKTAWRNLANLYFRAAQYEDALLTYQQANESGLNDLYLAMGEGNCLMQLKKINEAQIAYAQAVKSFPDSPLPLYSLAMACEKLQLFSDASNYLQKAAQFDHLPAFYKLFELHFAQKISLSEQQTADLSDKACRLTDFTDPWLMQILAASYLNTGKKNEAAGILHRALKLAEQQNKKSLADEITTNIKLCTEN